MKAADAYDAALAYALRHRGDGLYDGLTDAQREQAVIKAALHRYGASLRPSHERKLRSELRKRRAA